MVLVLRHSIGNRSILSVISIVSCFFSFTRLIGRPFVLNDMILCLNKDYEDDDDDDMINSHSSYHQFEFMSQHLVFANCIPLILKFLNQNIAAFIAAKNT